jgi:hypothetical protein
MTHTTAAPSSTTARVRRSAELSKWQAEPSGIAFDAISPGITPRTAPRKSAPEPPQRSAGATGAADKEPLLKARDRGMGGTAERQPLLRTTIGALRRIMKKMMVTEGLTRRSTTVRVHMEELTP